MIENLLAASRPVLVFGWGVHLSRAEAEARALAEMLQIPVCLTWGARDLFPEDCPYAIGGFGTHGTRAANFTVQNADYILSVGSRLDTKATGSPANWFARGARIDMVDMDEAEIEKMKHVGITVHGMVWDAGSFLSTFRRKLVGPNIPEWKTWLAIAQDWKARYPCQGRDVGGYDNPYRIIKSLSELCEPEEVIVSDTGCALAWMMQAFEFKTGQRFLHAMNNTPMGYGLPAAIGAYYANPRRVILVTGDGSIMMSLGELSTISRKRLPIKIVLMDNQGHAMCRQTEREWLGGIHHATDIEDLSFPDFLDLGRGIGLPVYESRYLKLMFNMEGPALCVIRVHPNADVEPKVRFGKPNEDGYPELPRDEFYQNMIVEPIGEKQ